MPKNQLSPNLQLNPRLFKLAGLVPKSRCIADIGTDHAYIPIWAVLNNVSEYAIASDINRGPVERARQNVQSFGLCDKISLRLGAGLSTVAAGETETIIIAGMGGILISNILDTAKEVVSTAKTLILQPMTAAKELREYLAKNNFELLNEHLVAEDEKIYNIMYVKVGGKTVLSESELFLGKNTDKTSPQLFDDYRRHIIKKFTKQLSGLEKSSFDENKKIAVEIRRILEIINRKEQCYD